ncbi:hypothetical protein [Paenirhodobacter sp.]|uniref:hypothetical protein n=1 Tax=Paenirhodobacter sp. TaxID=1965326 RepID=UPI003B409075
MIGFARLFVFGLVALTLLYWLVRIYGRSLRREELEKRWDAVRGADLGPRETYIETGLAAYEKSLRRKLIWLVYIVPVTAMIGVIIWINYHG